MEVLDVLSGDIEIVMKIEEQLRGRNVIRVSSFTPDYSHDDFPSRMIRVDFSC